MFNFTIPSLWLPEKANYVTDYTGVWSRPSTECFHSNLHFIGLFSHNWHSSACFIWQPAFSLLKSVLNVFPCQHISRVTFLNRLWHEATPLLRALEVVLPTVLGIEPKPLPWPRPPLPPLLYCLPTRALWFSWMFHVLFIASGPLHSPFLLSRIFFSLLPFLFAQANSHLSLRSQPGWHLLPYVFIVHCILPLEPL